jgi:hypothetical protein
MPTPTPTKTAASAACGAALNGVDGVEPALAAPFEHDGCRRRRGKCECGDEPRESAQKSFHEKASE